ncbi:hypothetical protein BpHYR1_028784 [Brachionus plicatilis]|uniref:Uncharacterized protein n=1 Tax=Brachionus plicatilis TaxID=10195 RepID=A0A3M7RS93_BRAPC|nr:hypothetical protein BpHYR1_028784 [Brachionus plicatilis]
MKKISLESQKGLSVGLTCHLIRIITLVSNTEPSLTDKLKFEINIKRSKYKLEKIFFFQSNYLTLRE